MKPTKIFALLLASLAWACVADKTDPNAVASFSGGTVDLQSVEERLRLTADVLDQGNRQGLVETYRDVATQIVVERTMLDRAIPNDEDLGFQESVRREVIIELFKTELLTQLEPIPVQAVEDFFEEHEGEFHRQPRRFVWHIFRRHQDPAHPDDTTQELATIKTKAQAGQSFINLARQFSQSETRINGGRLGWIGRDRLPPALEEIVFSLGKDEISDPVPVADGAALFMVSEVVRETRLGLNDVRSLIHQRLVTEALREKSMGTLGEESLPEGSIILDKEVFQAATTKALPDQVLLEVDDYRLTAGMLLELIVAEDTQVFRLPFLAPNPWQIYSDLVVDQRLYLHAKETGFPDRPAIATEIEQRVKMSSDAAIVIRSIEEAIREEVLATPESVESFFQSNRFLFQSPLRFKLSSLSLPIDRDNDERIAKLNHVRDAILNGTMDLPTAAAQIGADLIDLGWMDVSALQQLAPKLGRFVLDLEAGETSIPFQLNRRLNIVHVEDREEPKQLPFKQVEDQVFEDYLVRHKQQIYVDIQARLLKDARFRFHEDTVRRALE